MARMRCVDRSQRRWGLARVLFLVSLLASVLGGCGVARNAPVIRSPAPSPTAKADHQALYVGFATGLIAFRPRDGQKLWTQTNYGSMYSPVVDGDMLYTGANTEAGSQVLALRASDGAAVWKTTLDRPTWTAPILNSGVLYTVTKGSQWSSSGPSSSLYALDARTGSVMWRYQTAGNLNPMLYILGESIYASLDVDLPDLAGFSTTILALNRADGSVRWRKAESGQLLAEAVGDGMIYVGMYGNHFETPLIALNPATGAQLWRREETNRVAWIEASGGDNLYVGLENGSISALRPRNGAPLWTFSLAGGLDHSVDPPVTVRNGLLYVGSLSGYVALLDAATGATHWRVCIAYDSCDTPTDAADWSTPLVANGTIYIGVTWMHWHPPGESPGGVYALDAATGSILWQYQQFGGEVGAPALVNPPS